MKEREIEAKRMEVMVEIVKAIESNEDVRSVMEKGIAELKAMGCSAFPLPEEEPKREDVDFALNVYEDGKKWFYLWIRYDCPIFESKEKLFEHLLIIGPACKYQEEWKRRVFLDGAWSVLKRILPYESQRQEAQI